MGRGKLGTGELGYNCPPFHSRGSKFSEKKLRKQVASLSINQSIEIIKIKIQSFLFSNFPVGLRIKKKKSINVIYPLSLRRKETK